METKDKEWWKVKSIQYVKKISPPVLSTLVTRRRSAPSRRASEPGSITGRINSAQIASTPRIANGNPSGSPFVSAGAFAFAKTFAQKAMIVRKSRNEHAEEVFERSRQMLESCNFATIDCSFNLPRVNAQLERLMGSNVVHLTDRKYMVELRRRITEDFENMLMKRINQRKQEEVERQMKLLLHGLYNVQNVPPKLISAHSIVLAEEIQRQRVLLMDGKLLKCPKELRNHPVLIINESTNKFLIKRRAKLKTERERVSERIIRLGKKWEADHLLWEEREKQKEVEMKLKEMEMLASDKHYFAHLESVNGRVNLEKKFQKTELNMVAFLVKEKQLMQNRLKPKEKEFKPFTKDIRVVDAKRRMSEASVHKLKSLAAKIRATNPLEDSSEDKTEDKTEEKTDTQSRDQDQDSIVTQSESTVEKKKKKGSILSIFKSKNKNKSKNKRKKDETTSQGEETTSQAEPSLGEPSSPEQSPKAEKHHKESTDSSIESELSKVVVRIDPVVQELKGAKNVTELYRIAEQIVGTNIDNILDKSKSNEDDE